MAPLPDTVAVRDSKDRHGPALGFDHGEWTAFIDAARAGALAR